MILVDNSMNVATFDVYFSFVAGKIAESCFYLA